LYLFAKEIDRGTVRKNHYSLRTLLDEISQAEKIYAFRMMEDPVME